MFRYIFVVFTLFILFEACAQTKPAAVGYIFMQPSFKGNIPVDDEGNPVHSGIDTFYFAIIELDSSVNLIIDSIMYKGKHLPATAFKMEEKIWNGGTISNSGQRIIMEAGEGKLFWRIEFTSNDNANIKGKEPAIIKGKKDGKAFILKLNQEIELSPVEKY